MAERLVTGGYLDPDGLPGFAGAVGALTDRADLAWRSETVIDRFAAELPALLTPRGFALVLLTSCILLGAEMFGFTPDEDKLELKARKQISESLAIQFALLDPKRDIKKLERLLTLVAKRNPDILSTGIRRESGQLVYKSPNHDRLWQEFKGDKS